VAGPLAPPPKIPEVDEEVVDLVREAYRRFPSESDAVGMLFSNRMNGGNSRVRRLLAFRLSEPEWLRLPADLPRPFGLQDAEAWTLDIPLRSPLPWCKELIAGSHFETDGVPAHLSVVVLLRGLATAAFNGRAGVLQKWIPDSGRWQVKLATGKSLNRFLQSYNCCDRLSGDEPPRLFRREHLLLFDIINFKDS